MGILSTMANRTRPSNRRRSSASETTIGLLAGSGRFPILFAEAARRQGLKVACVGIRYEAPDVLADLCDSFQVVGVTKLGGMIRAFKYRNVNRIVMAGKVTKNVMYTPIANGSTLAGLPDDAHVVRVASRR